MSALMGHTPPVFGMQSCSRLDEPPQMWFHRLGLLRITLRPSVLSRNQGV